MDILNDYTSWQYWTLLIGVWALIPLVVWIDRRIQKRQQEHVKTACVPVTPASSLAEKLIKTCTYDDSALESKNGFFCDSKVVAQAYLNLLNRQDRLDKWVMNFPISCEPVKSVAEALKEQQDTVKEKA